MGNQIDLSISKDRRAWAWSNALRSAMNFPDKESVKKMVSAALADGWIMDRALVEKDGGPECHEASLPELAAWSTGWREEERSPMVDALSELGVDWCQSGPGSEGSLVAKAAKFGNWVAMRSMAEAGASLLGGEDGRAYPGSSPVALFWGRLDALDWRVGERGGRVGCKQGVQGAIQAALTISKQQLADAFASGEADPKKWLPALAVCIHQSAVLGSSDPVAGGRAMEGFLAWARAWGCDDWSEPVNGSLAMDMAELGEVQNPTFALWMAFHAVEAPAAWAAALGDAGLGIKMDARSMWAVGQSVGRSCVDASRWEELSESGRLILGSLEQLKAWAPMIALSSKKPTARSSGGEGHIESIGFESSMVQGWGSACASMCSGPGWDFNDERASNSQGLGSKANLGKVLAVAAKNAAGAMEWAGLGADAPGWGEFAEEFAGCFARNTAWTAWAQRGDQKFGEMGLARSSGALINSAKCAIAVLGHLSKAIGAGGPELADRCLECLALDFGQGLAQGLVQEPSGQAWGWAIAEVAAVLPEAVWAAPKTAPGLGAWTALCSKAIGALSKEDHGQAAGVSRSLALLEHFVMGGSCATGMRPSAASLRV